MDSKRLLAPVMAAFSIQEQYHKDVQARLRAYGLDEEDQSTIITDIYAKDDIYFSLNRPYENITSTFDDFCKERKLDTALPDMFSFIQGTKKLYTHQAKAIDSILAEKTTIISTGTGSGKTESFLIPIFHHCLIQKRQHVAGIKALILYPLNALADDQIRRIKDAVKGKGIRVGCFVGSTPHNKKRTENDPEELCISREEMIKQPPDILITNYIMLDRLLTKPETYRIFKHSIYSLKYIVVDEIHSFRGTKGANLSLLLRRLRALCQQHLVQIGASGTLRRGGGYYPNQTENQIELFTRLIFGQDALIMKGFTLVEPVFQTDEPDEKVETLPRNDSIDGETFLPNLSETAIAELCQQIFGPAIVAEYQQKYCQPGKGLKAFPGYYLALYSPFIATIRKDLTQHACSFQNFVEKFETQYEQAYHYAPKDPKKVVEAYWSLINYLNTRCASAKLPLILDYRIHLVLSNVGDALTRCLLCQRYHDGRCRRCRNCNNGLLFKVSKADPCQCIAYLVGEFLSSKPPSGQRTFPVFVRFVQSQNKSHEVPLFTLQTYLATVEEEEGYIVAPLAEDASFGVALQLIQQKKDEEVLLLSERHMYWQNVLKIVDALVVQPKTRSSDKLLGFIDSRERASSIKLRLNDDIAERTLSAWAARIWERNDFLNLVEAFEQLQNHLSPVGEDASEEKRTFSELLQEMPFWYKRMLTYLEDSSYEYWNITIDPDLKHNPDEYEILEQVLLPSNAIDTTGFLQPEVSMLKHFYVEKYRVETQYGVGMESTDERGYTIISLGDHGLLYKGLIERFGSDELREMLQQLTARGILIKKTTPAGKLFYQLCPDRVGIQLTTPAPPWDEIFATVECHTADNSDKERKEIERRFNNEQIQSLICTPTLEMGVDIGNLSSVMMIGFPPSPANYAQRAGRAGRSAKDRQATIVVLSSSDDMHDEYYYALPNKMIDGQITPPQFSLRNFALLAAHTYAYIVTGARDTSRLMQPHLLKEQIERFLRYDELLLASTLGKQEYDRFAHYLMDDSQEIPARLRRLVYGQPGIEDYYRHGIFPDYGFRNDGLPLVDKSAKKFTEEEEGCALTSREPEGAPHMLAPGRIVFCGGKAVKVEENQPGTSYEIYKDPLDQPFRYPRYVEADTTRTVQIKRLHDPNRRYRLSRFLDCKVPLQSLLECGRQYCHVYCVPESTLYFINEGEVQNSDRSPTRLQDHNGAYRFGTILEREGLLIRFDERILSSHMKANFLAVLLRSIPDYFNLDDTELRVVQNIRLHPYTQQQTQPTANFFIYGHDKSGLVPFKEIFEKLDNMLLHALNKLNACPCDKKGCYLCLFSMNSHALTGHISAEEAIEFLSAYLGKARLKPFISATQAQDTRPDLMLRLKLQGDQWEIIAQKLDGSIPKQYREKIQGGQNETLYRLLHQVLKQGREEEARSVRIYCRLDYVLKQLRGENDIKRGRDDFFNVWLERLKWEYWQVEKEDQTW